MPLVTALTYALGNTSSIGSLKVVATVEEIFGMASTSRLVFFDSGTPLFAPLEAFTAVQMIIFNKTSPKESSEAN